MRCKKRGLFILVLSIFLVVLTSYFVAATPGCYVYAGGNEDIYCDASDPDSDDTSQVLIDDCNNFADCDLNTHFIPNDDCSTIPECQQVTCNVDCSLHALGWCQQIAEDQQGPPGQSVPANQFNDLCSQGCCNIQGSQFCQVTNNEWECSLQHQLVGSGTKVFLPGTVNPECTTNICAATTLNPGTLTGTVLDQAGAFILVPITVELLGTAIPSVEAVLSTGVYTFPDPLNPGTYQVRASATGYISSVSSVSIGPGEAEVQDFTLTQAVGSFTVDGIVIDSTNNVPLADALIYWTGPQNGQVFTLNDGSFIIVGIPAATYTIQASKVGYTFAEQTVDVSADLTLPDFNLQEIVTQGISGRVQYEDTSPAQGASIFVDSIFEGFSIGSSGTFTLTGISDGPHEITATSQGFDSVPQTFTLNTVNNQPVISQNGQTVPELLITLIPYQGECSDPADYKDVDQATFTANHVPGKEEVKLSWAKPCREVRGYDILKYEGGNLVETIQASLIARTFTDTNVQWGGTYRYEIRVNYDQPFSSPNIIQAQITLGDARCEDRFQTGQADTFCLLGVNNQQVYTCSNENVLLNQIDCFNQWSPRHYCAPSSPTTATCKDVGPCDQANFNPFGLYSSADECYGTQTPQDGNAVNYCYYDYTESPVNSCESCLEIVNCFDYESRAACETNSCFTEQCAWINSAQETPANPLVDYSILGFSIPSADVTPETGTGYCTEVDYKEDDTCSLCGSGGDIFENYYCTAEVCSSLGRCLSNPPSVDPLLTSCLDCGEEASADRNCYSYQTELECTNGNPTNLVSGTIIESEDSCNWGRCAWTGGACVKDGDASGGNGDCDQLSGIKHSRCLIDNLPPTTTIIPAGFQTLSHSSGPITFRAVDEDNSLGFLYYCLENANAPGTCQTESDFTSLTYPGIQLDETVSDFINDSTYLTGQQINGETFKLIYYSKDEFFNQEDWQESFLFVDNVKPTFIIAYTEDTSGSTTDLTITLTDLNEPADCTFDLTRTIPRGGAAIAQQRKDIDTLQKEVIFTGLDGVGYDAVVSCTDSIGNVHTDTQTIILDVEPNIDIIHPPFGGAVRETRIAFQVSTLFQASCSLFDANNQLLAEFNTDPSGRTHQTVELAGFIQREYAAEHQVICTNILGEEFTDYFHFAVDFTAPQTQIVLTEGLRESRPIGINAYELWQEFFVNTVDVTFECVEESLSFTCDQTFYCLGEDCELINDPGYQEYTEPLSLAESTQICYYSTDVGGNAPFQPVCGEIIVDGLGISLVNPEMHTYQGEIWGISNTPDFDLQFITRMPTTECRFDFSRNFNYQNQPQHKIATPDSNGVYTFANFPTGVFASAYSNNGGVKEIYVKCTDSLGDTGPEQKINLEYDPSAPQITSSDARPDPVVNGISTTLFLSTNDKTLCRYSDNSDDLGSAEYGTMEFSFPGESRNVLDTQHEDEYFVNNFVGASKDFKINAMCRNGAGDLSEVEEITFTVDYSLLGNIINISPDDESFQSTTIPLRVITNKDAFCEYRLNSSYTAFSTTDSRTFTDTLTGLNEGEYEIPVRCRIADRLAQAAIRFGVDFTSPVIDNVNDGNYTCGSSFINVYVSVNETRLGSFDYELYDHGTSAFGSGTLVSSDRTGPDQPIRISTQSLTEGNRYSVEVQATDAAGNVGRSFVGSDGVFVVSSNHSACQDDAGPEITFNIDDTLCSSLAVELECTDGVGCGDIRYGVHPTSTLCSASKGYTGQKIELDQTSWICYVAEDVLSQNNTGQRKIVFADEDGDGITDSCDVCENTGAGKVVDIEGCADGQNRPGASDTDKDSLPDTWEQTYDAFDCPLDYLSIDSDANGIDDNLEDYDNDGRINFEEFLDNTHPCIFDTSRTTGPSTGGAKDSNLLAWIFLIVGLVLVLGGTGYLIYYYRSAPKVRRPLARVPGKPAHQAPHVPKASPWMKKISQLRRSNVKKSKVRQRKQLFGAFGSAKKTAAPKPTSTKPKKVITPSPKKVVKKPKSEEDIFAKLKKIGKEKK